MAMIQDDIVARNLLDNIGISEILAMKGTTEVAINQPFKLWFDRGNGWEFVEKPELTYEKCKMLANTLCVYSGLNYSTDNYDTPIASVVLPDGERGQIIAPPACEKKTVAFGIRKPSIERFSLQSYRDTGRLSGAKKAQPKSIELSSFQEEMLNLYEKNDNQYEFLVKALEAKLNILLVGETGSGKTTIMKAMLDIYHESARIFTIEDVSEIDLPHHPNHVHLFYKENGVTPTQLVKACMRLKPDHIFLAELRGDEALPYLEALNTGHSGTITTIHANDCYSAFSRLTDLIKKSSVGITMNYQDIFRKVITTIDVVCFFNRTHLTEIYYNPIEQNKYEAMGIIGGIN